MPEINYDDVYNQLMSFIDAITTKENVNKKNIENLIKKLERSIDFDTFLLTGEVADDFPF